MDKQFQKKPIRHFRFADLYRAFDIKFRFIFIFMLERNKHPRDEIIDRKLSCVPFVPFFALLNSFETMRSGDGVSRK